MTKDQLYEQLFNLRNKQANCPAEERANIQKEIEQVLKQIDNYDKLTVIFQEMDDLGLG